MPTAAELADQFLQQKPNAAQLADQFLKDPGGQSLSNIPQGQSKLPDEDMSGATGWKSGEYGKWQKIPSFMTKLEAIGSSAAEGLMDFSAALLNQTGKIGKGTFLDKYPSGTNENIGTEAHKYWSDKNKQMSEEYSGLGGYQVAGKLIPDLAMFGVASKAAGALGEGASALGTLLKGAKVPGTDLGIMGVNATGKALEVMGQGPKAIGAAAPNFTKTVAEYGSAAARDVGLLSAVEGARFNPNNPDAIFNPEQAAEVLQNPWMAAGASILGNKVSNYLGDVRKLGQAKDEYSPYVMMHQLDEPGPAKTVKMKMFAALPNLFGFGKLVDQLGAIAPDVRNFAGKLFGNASVTRGIDAGEVAARNIQAALKRTKHAEDRAWKAVPTDKEITDPNSILAEVKKAQEILAGSKIPLETKTVSYLDKNIPKKTVTEEKTVTPKSEILGPEGQSLYSKPQTITSQKEVLGKMTIADAKEIQSLIGGASMNARSIKGGGATAKKMADDLQEIRENILNTIRSSLGEAETAAFDKARGISKHNFELLSISPTVAKAVKNGVMAQKIADKMITDKGWKSMQPVFNEMSTQGQKSVAQYKVLQTLDAATDGTGKVHLDGFLKATSELTRTGEIMGDTYQAFKGFSAYLKSLEEEASTGWWTQATILGTAGAATLGGSKMSLPMKAAAILSYPLMTAIANHSPLKSLLHAFTRKLPDSTYKAVSDAIGRYLARIGMSVSEDGGYKLKDEDKK